MPWKKCAPEHMPLGAKVRTIYGKLTTYDRRCKDGYHTDRKFWGFFGGKDCATWLPKNRLVEIWEEDEC